MTTLVVEQVRAIGVRFVDDVLHVALSDKREISVPMEHVPWLEWLVKATPAQRADWSIEPQGFAIYWDELDDGIEICHLLGMQPMA
ncbi:MAG: DUF2442 domain-containing protein [Anaerolineae bacterium]|jgi:hypothetical protein